MRRKRMLLAALGLGLAWQGSAEAQTPSLPLLPARGSSSGVSPVYEGWYRNPDGTFTLSFGYINRNRETVVEIPVGENNFVEPAQYNSYQPTHFEPFRHYGWFAVQVPADFGENEVVWTIQHNGQRFAIPARIQDGYEIDAMLAPASGETPPTMSFVGAAEVRGPYGIKVGPLAARVGQPLDLNVSGKDEHSNITVRWYKYAGPGQVTFAHNELPIAEEGASAATTATFSAPGEYTLYARANNSPLVSSGQEQCCWTNGYVKVTVTQ